MPNPQPRDAQQEARAFSREIKKAHHRDWQALPAAERERQIAAAKARSAAAERKEKK
jgi:hypothetical protein